MYYNRVTERKYMRNKIWIGEMRANFEIEMSAVASNFRTKNTHVDGSGKSV